MSIDAMDILEDPDKIFNGDETGFSLCPKSGKVLGPRGYKNVFIFKNNNEKEKYYGTISIFSKRKIMPTVSNFSICKSPKRISQQHARVLGSWPF